MILCALTCSEFLAYNQQESIRWREFFAANPAALDLPCDIMRSTSTREFLRHIFAVELRYSQRLLDQEMVAPESLPMDSVDSLFAIHDRAMHAYEQFLAAANGPVLEEQIEVTTRVAGPIRVSRRKLFNHAMMHGVRHWAQLATQLRHQGFASSWHHDFLFSNAID
jgi:uncharacterized damage-inducible protein DinB